MAQGSKRRKTSRETSAEIIARLVEENKEALKRLADK